VSVYHLLQNSKTNTSQDRKLLSSRLLSVHSAGWEVFSITHAVRSWMSDEGSNMGLLVTVRTLGGSDVDSKLVRFASGRDHHQSKQPMLVLFTDDGRRASSLENTVNDLNKNSDVPSMPLAPKLSGRAGRIARSLDPEDERLPCQRLPLYVDFEEIGWSGWIVSPRGYNAYHCKGSCPFPLGQNMRPTNHATVQSIINALKLTKGIETPCCVADKLFSINLLYFDDDENVVLKQYDDMVAGSCGCH
ncbi:BMP7 protein, partial [Amia calva]|nr:BMP7 protein [Amia calva]